MSYSAIETRRKSHAVMVGSVQVGGGAPIVVQSMTNTDTADIEGTARQTAALARAGSELVRITVDKDEAAKAVPTSVTGLTRWVFQCRSWVISTTTATRC